MYEKGTNLDPDASRPFGGKGGLVWFLVSLVCNLVFAFSSTITFSQDPISPDPIGQRDSLPRYPKLSPTDVLTLGGEPSAVTDVQKPKFIPRPSKSWKYSAILPGWGQAYNRSYWKIPVIYAGLGAVIYVYTFNNRQFHKWRNAYIAKLDPEIPDEYPNASIHAIKNQMDFFRRNREYTVLAGVAVWALNVLEAYVYAHLLNFDVSEDLSLRIEPYTVPTKNFDGIASNSLSLKLTLNF